MAAADVVPRNEVEKAKQEVAEQIVNEFRVMISDFFNRKILTHEFNSRFYELEKKYIGEMTENE